MRKEADDTGPLAELEHWRFLEVMVSTKTFFRKFFSKFEIKNGHHSHSAFQFVPGAAERTKMSLRHSNFIICKVESLEQVETNRHENHRPGNKDILETDTKIVVFTPS